MQRAHSVVTIKRADSDTRKIRGIASTPATDRQGDELEPLGATFKLPYPLLLGHDHAQPIGEVIEARATPAGIHIVAQIAPEGVSDRIDEAWRLIRAGLIKGLSVGFIGTDWDSLPRGGRKYTKWEIIETSAVAVPANRDAEILEVKRADVAKAQAAENTDLFPDFPRSLSKADRDTLLRGASDQWSQDLVTRSKKAGLRMTGVDEAFTRVLGDMIIHQRWAIQRIEELEGKSNAG